MIHSLITTYNRPEALARTLPQVVALGSPVLVVDDGSENADVIGTICREHGADHLRLPFNRGLAAALNIGLDFIMADCRVSVISYFQDDVDVHPKTHEMLLPMLNYSPLATGHDAREHRDAASGKVEGRTVHYKLSCRATHLFAGVSFWRMVMPIPTVLLGAPKGGHGSNVDWWIVRDSPGSVQALNQKVICIPRLVRTFLWKSQDSCWGNRRAVEEPPLRACAS